MHGSRAHGALATAIALATLALAALVAFAPAFEAGFVLLDDDYNVLANPHFRGLSRENLLWMFSASWNGNYQPLAWISLAGDYAISEMSPARYHVTNVLIHLATAWLFFFVARSMLSRFSRSPLSPPSLSIRGADGLGTTFAALVASLVFAVHPLRAESVAWVTDRNDLLAGFFAVAAVGSWLRYAGRGEHEGAPTKPALPGPMLSRTAIVSALAAALFLAAVVASLDTSDPDRLGLRAFGGFGLALASAAFVTSVAAASRDSESAPRARLWHAATCGLFSLSLISKGAAVSLPLVLVVLDAVPLRRLRRVAWQRLVVEKIPLAALSLGAAFLAGWARHARIGSSTWVAERGLLERVAQSIQALAFYPWKTLVPRGLVPIVDVPARARWLEPELLVPILGVAVVAALAIGLAFGLGVRRRRAPALLAALLAYALLVAPALGLVPFGTQLVSDRYSYVSCMPLALLAGGAWLAWMASPRWLSRLAVPAALAIALILVLLARAQAAVWHDSESLFTHQLRFDDTPRALSNLAIVWNEKAASDPAEREAWLARAAELSTRAVETAQARGVFIPEYRLHLGTILLNQGKTEEALAHLEWFVAQRPENMQGWSNLGLALLSLRRFDDAAATLKRAVAGGEGSAGVWRLLGMAFEGQGRRSDAIGAYRRALGLAPGLPAAAERLRELESAR